MGLEPLCRHCGLRRIARPRSLCWGCYKHHRHLYPSRANVSPLSLAQDTVFDAPLPAHPTTAPPGSAAKIDVLMRRAKACVSLFHPDDAGFAAFNDVQVVKLAELFDLRLGRKMARRKRKKK